jgi:hypothetical protein
MIVDEADLTLESLISFDRSAMLMNGLYFLKSAQKVIYMSATMSSYFKNVIRIAFGNSPQYLEFKSQYQISSKDNDPYRIDDVSFGDVYSMMEYLISDIERMAALRNEDKFPMMFFIEQWNESIVINLDEAIRKVYGGRSLIQIKDAEALQRVQS